MGEGDECAGLAHLEASQHEEAMATFSEAALQLMQLPDCASATQVIPASENLLPSAFDKDSSDRLLQGSRMDIRISRQRLKLCVQYKLAAMLLGRVQQLRKPPSEGGAADKVEVSRLSRHLTSLRVDAKYRIIYLRGAVHHNMEARNFGFAKRTLELLISKCPPALRAGFKVQLKKCESHSASNSSVPPSENAALFDSQTAEILGQDFFTCTVCEAHFSQALTACAHCGSQLKSHHQG
ncbi:hypothetical protein CYMTET_41230 [Cymbomonas tetramitiformis]|uniref:Uncharacterized protein n=1 Tax=Cymbomonas tetramitiformis TaxID=36881 RepID=A0AAE0C8P1_9CHLO|nr:hypothetical protein CYMTET_41230 [Cymbomonas tetramitiformis]